VEEWWCPGRTGRNFAAGMSAPLRHHHDEGILLSDAIFRLVDLEKLDDPDEERFVRSLSSRHAELRRAFRAERFSSIGKNSERVIK